ncbi:MAG: DUF3293 domain-containing protein [Gemmatimonadaceae bacterium]
MFHQTILYFRTDPPLRIDLRRDLSASDRSMLGGLGLGRSFCIVTAEDPMGVAQAADVNDALVARLRERARQIEAVQVDVDACGVDGSHCENSIAIAINIQAAIRLADVYRQLAIFWFDGDAFWIIPVRSNKAKLKLP